MIFGIRRLEIPNLRIPDSGKALHVSELPHAEKFSRDNEVNSMNGGSRSQMTSDEKFTEN
jgi:hypothetical protein